MESQHEHQRGLPLHEHLGTQEAPAQAQGRWRDQRTAHRRAHPRLDLRGRLHDRNRHPGRLRRRHHGSQVRLHNRGHAVQSRSLWVPLPQPVSGRRQRRGARKHGTLGPDHGPEVAQGQRQGPGWRPEPHHDLRGVGRRRLGLAPSDVTRVEGLGAQGNTPERYPERTLELHDRRESQRGRKSTRRGLRMQLHHARGQPGQGHGLHEERRSQDDIGPAVEQLHWNSGIPVGTHYRRYFPDQGSARHAPGDRLRQDGDHNREQRERR